MVETQQISLFAASRRDIGLSWGFILLLVINFTTGISVGQYEPALFSIIALGILLAPVIRLVNPTMVPPWYLTGVVSLPVLSQTIAPDLFATELLPSIALATLSLLFIIQLHDITSLSLVPWFAVVLTTLFSMAMGALVQITQWTLDQLVGTSFLLDGRSQDTLNTVVMLELMQITGAGIVAGLCFYAAFKRELISLESCESPVTDPVPEEKAILSYRLGISQRRQQQIVRLMRVILVGILIYGLWQLDLAVITNATIALAVTYIPRILRRNFRLSVDPGIALWVTAAVFFHTLGTLALYDGITRWDWLTHSLSASVVAAAGYAALRSIHLYDDRIHLPPWGLFVFTIIFVLAMGVVWEIMEFFADQGALILGLDPVLAQYGVDDTIVDMIFNVVGAIITAFWGTAYLTVFSDSLAKRIEEWNSP